MHVCLLTQICHLNECLTSFQQKFFFEFRSINSLAFNYVVSATYCVWFVSVHCSLGDESWLNLLIYYCWNEYLNCVWVSLCVLNILISYTSQKLYRNSSVFSSYLMHEMINIIVCVIKWVWCFYVLKCTSEISQTVYHNKIYIHLYLIHIGVLIVVSATI